MRYFIFAVFLLTVKGADAQQFYQASFSTLSPKELAHTLTSHFKTDQQKVYALFRWITEALHKKDMWLDVMCEDEVVLRYKLIIKERGQ